ncbi:unnamed protein product [Gadus morhua 'NCC']
MSTQCWMTALGGRAPHEYKTPHRRALISSVTVPSWRAPRSCERADGSAGARIGAQTQRCADFTPLVEPPYVSPSPGRRQPESELHWSSAEFRGKLRKVTTKCRSAWRGVASPNAGCCFLPSCWFVAQPTSSGEVGASS